MEAACGRRRELGRRRARRYFTSYIRGCAVDSTRHLTSVWTDDRCPFCTLKRRAAEIRAREIDVIQAGVREVRLLQSSPTKPHRSENGARELEPFRGESIVETEVLNHLNMRGVEPADPRASPLDLIQRPADDRVPHKKVANGQFVRS
jgi:hypothetical protein